MELKCRQHSAALVHIVTSGELQKSLTRPDVEVKFANNVTFKIPFIEGEGQILVVFGSGLLRLGLGGLGLGNCLVYDFR